jgi:hypothetical protein
MKPLGKFNALALLAGMFLANAALAQPEQWLQYHIEREGRSAHWLELTTNRPPNVALPKLGAKPLFAHWTTGLDPKVRFENIVPWNSSGKVGLSKVVFRQAPDSSRRAQAR